MQEPHGAPQRETAEGLTWIFENDKFYDARTGVELVSDSQDEALEEEE